VSEPKAPPPPATGPTDCCGTCVFYRVGLEVDPRIVQPSTPGSCHRNAPRPVAHVGDLTDPRVAWPGVAEDDWCGEWKDVL